MEGRRDDACAPSPPPLQLVSGLLACAAGLLSPPWSSDGVRWPGREVGEQGDVEFDDKLEARRDGAHASSPWVACIPKKHSIYVQYTLCCLQSDYPITVGCSTYVSM